MTYNQCNEQCWLIDMNIPNNEGDYDKITSTGCTVNKNVFID